MSRYNRVGTHPESGEKVNVAYGWDVVPGFKPGYFFQVFDPKNEDLTLVNEGFLNGIEEDRLNELKKRWKVR
jgi:hypothetical protein